MSAEHTDLRLRTLYTCDANDCHHKYGISYRWPGQDLKESDFSWEYQQAAKERGTWMLQDAYTKAGWTTHTTLDRNNGHQQTRHYCPEHQPPAWLNAHPTNLEGTQQ